ncbi:hypothetical protein U1Q18_050337 [Sarracenia purpurea var. burkii]
MFSISRRSSNSMTTINATGNWYRWKFQECFSSRNSDVNTFVTVKMEYEYNMAVPYYNHMVLGASIIDSSIYDATGWNSTCYAGDYSVHAAENPYGFQLGPNDTYDLSYDNLLLQQEQKLERLERERLEIERDYCASMKMLLGTQQMELESAKYRQAGTNVVKEATQRRDGYVIIQMEPDDEVLSPPNNSLGEMSSSVSLLEPTTRYTSLYTKKRQESDTLFQIC